MVQELERQQGLPRPACLPEDLLTPRGLLQAAEDHPLGVVKRRDQYLCVSGLRLYRTLRQDLPDSAVVAIRVYRCLRQEQLSDLIIRDCFLSPGIVGFRPDDRRACARVWQTLPATSVLTNYVRVIGKRGFARLLGLHERRLRGGNHA